MSTPAVSDPAVPPPPPTYRFRIYYRLVNPLGKDEHEVATWTAWFDGPSLPAQDDVIYVYGDDGVCSIVVICREFDPVDRDNNVYHIKVRLGPNTTVSYLRESLRRSDLNNNVIEPPE